TVPPIHLIESSAGDDIAVFQIKQAGRAQFGRVHLPRPSDDHWQMFYLHTALLLHLRDRRWRREIGWQVQDGALRQLGIDHATALRRGTRRRGTAARNVAPDRSQPLLANCSLWSSGRTAGLDQANR